ncbi:MAG: hypothetical protein JO316_15420 [Abitibacteriaceae bacterium]|nr:hypothetical protein [Abditibacteriaceae bacterium]MBV9866743.1 hypothetical protein [Abditibacteriaceae bacterium]
MFNHCPNFRSLAFAVRLSPHRARDGKSFNGTTFATSPVVNGKAQPFTLTTNLDVAKGVWARRIGLPAGSDLQAGDYRLLAVAVDGAGNRAQATGTFTVPSNMTAKTPATSTIALSTAKASVATNSVQLRFLGALDAESAGDAVHYTVTVNGMVVMVESAGYDATNRSVTLGLPDGSLHVGDKVLVKWSGLLDARQQTLMGQTSLMAGK